MNAEHRYADTAIGLAREACDALPAGKVGVNGTDIAGREAGLRRRLDDLDREFVTHHARIFQERVLALENVIIGTAEADTARSDQRLSRRRLWRGSLYHLQPARFGANKSVYAQHGVTCRNR